VQTLLNGTAGVVVIATITILLFAFAYVFVLVSSSRRIIMEQQSRIDEIQKSEERYKALFQNSLAGMMKFSIAPFIIFETNGTILEMFNVRNDYELQQLLSDLPNGQTQMIEAALKNKGVIDAFEIEFATASGIKRRFLLSAKKESKENLAHAVVILMTAERMIG
jgi:PAS domain-containing protein